MHTQAFVLMYILYRCENEILRQCNTLTLVSYTSGGLVPCCEASCCPKCYCDASNLLNHQFKTFHKKVLTSKVGRAWWQSDNRWSKREWGRGESGGKKEENEEKFSFASDKMKFQSWSNKTTEWHVLMITLIGGLLWDLTMNQEGLMFKCMYYWKWREGVGKQRGNSRWIE